MRKWLETYTIENNEKVVPIRHIEGNIYEFCKFSYVRCFGGEKHDREFEDYLIERLYKFNKKKDIVKLLRKAKIKDLFRGFINEYNPRIWIGCFKCFLTNIRFTTKEDDLYLQLKIDLNEDVCKDFYEKRGKERDRFEKKMSIIRWRETKRIHMGLGKK